MPKIQTIKKMCVDKLLLRYVTETKKVNNLLNLLFDDVKQKKIWVRLSR